MVGDREEPEEKIEKCDEFGQALEGYISLKQAHVLAIQRAGQPRLLRRPPTALTRPV